MLKRLLTVVLVLMLVVGVSGIASAKPPKPPKPPKPACDVCKILIDAELKLNLDLDVRDLRRVDDNNITAICQDGNNNEVGWVMQCHGGNLLILEQSGSQCDVDFVMQYNTASASGKNLVVISQDGYNNDVIGIMQWR